MVRAVANELVTKRVGPMLDEEPAAVVSPVGFTVVSFRARGTRQDVTGRSVSLPFNESPDVLCAASTITCNRPSRNVNKEGIEGN
jgi:hypothetical protein